MGYIQLLKKGHWLATSQNYENRGKTAFKKKKKDFSLFTCLRGSLKSFTTFYCCFCFISFRFFHSTIKNEVCFLCMKNEHKQWPPGQLEIFLGNMSFLQFSVQSLSCVQLFVTPWTAACQVSLSVTNSWSLLKLMSVESVMPTNHLVLCHPLLCLPAIFPSIRVFSHESVLCIWWPKY